MKENLANHREVKERKEFASTYPDIVLKSLPQLVYIFVVSYFQIYLLFKDNPVRLVYFNKKDKIT